ncbi:MAG: hypothetical protein K2X93_10405 [Candidatus Obscuribacterales bacterium]|nr:hypothetical protein [Candidatus Obscuribacterales bacterium]
MVSEGGSKDETQSGNSSNSSSDVTKESEVETSSKDASQDSPGARREDTNTSSTKSASSGNDLQEDSSREKPGVDTISTGATQESAESSQAKQTASPAETGAPPASGANIDQSTDESKVVVEPNSSPTEKSHQVTSKPAADLPVYRENKPLFIGCIAIAVLLICRLVWAQIIHPMRIGWDPALHLQAAQVIVEGGIPYIDVVDCNPPLIWYLDTIPAYLSKVLEFPVTQAFNFFLTVIIAYSVAACIALLFTKGKRSESWMFIPFIIGLTMFNFFLKHDFGQREEIYVLFYIPLLVARWLSWEGRGVKSKFWAWVIGIVGAMGICIKPYFIIPTALIELYFVLEKRTLRPLITTENIACLVGCIAYAAHFLLVPASMRDYYFGFLVPSYNIGYHYWDVSLGGSFSDPWRRDVFYLNSIVFLLAVGLRRRSSLMLPLAIFSLAGDIVYLLQFKGWHYHDQPVYAASFILAWMEGFCILIFGGKALLSLFGKIAGGRTIVLPKAVMPTVLVLLVAAGCIYDGNEDYKNVVGEVHRFDMSLIGYKGTTPWSDVDGPYTEFVLNNWKLGDKVLFMSNGVTPGYPWLTQLRCIPASRHLHMVVLSVLQYIEETTKNTPDYAKFREDTHRIVMEYVEDIRKNKPVLIFMQIGPDYFVQPFDFINQYLQDYDELKTIDNFRVFKRKKGR